MRIKNTFTGRIPDKGEKNNGISLTIPDNTLSVRELVARFAQGKPLTQDARYYNVEGEVPDISRMDFVDVDNLKKRIAEEVQSNKLKKNEYFTTKYSKKEPPKEA